MPVFITENELAARWNIACSTLQNRRCQGTGVVFYKIGGAIRYKLSDIEEAEKAASRTCCSAATA